MDLNNKRLLVIGGAGLIGSHTVEQLLRHDVAEIRVFDNLSRGTKENLAEALQDKRVALFPLGGELLHRDVLNAAMEGVDGVFHFAAMWLLHCWDYPRSAFEVNIGGTFNVVEAMLNNGVERLVFSSSASVYGDALEEPMTETHPLRNTNFYGATKIAGEQICRSLFHRFKDTDQRFDFAGLRYMNVYGPRQDYRGAYIAVIMKMLDRIDRGLPPIVYGDGTQAYDFVNVVDCARANVLAMQADVTDRFYNVGTGVKTSVVDLARILLELSDSDLPIEFQPAGLTFVKNRIGSPRRARAELGFEANTGLTDGLRALIDWRATAKSQVARRRREAGIEGGD
jgi:UDP-glucose 4-epimerase